MSLYRKTARPALRNSAGFSLLELLVSVAIIIILMAIILTFLNFNQKVYVSQQLNSEVTQGGRNAFEVMTQELNQAGYNPPFSSNKTLTTTTPISGTNLSLLTISPDTSRIFYGSSLVIGNNCGTVTTANCDQETVQVTGNSSNGLSSTQVPVALTNTHLTGEAIFDRNYPFPTGILYNNRPTSGQPGPYAVAVNTIRFFGALGTNSNNLYYGEYRLQCPGTTAGTWIPACTTGCMAGPFTLTRFMTKLINSSSIFSIPASIATANTTTVSPIVNNIQGTCATGSSSWSETVGDETSSSGYTTVKAAVSAWSGNSATTYVNPVLNPNSTTVNGATVYTPAMWLKMETWGSCDASTSPCTPIYTSLVTDIEVQLSIQESSIDPVTGKQATQILQTHISPKNTNDAWGVALNGGSGSLPGTPSDPVSGHTLPLGCSYSGGYGAATQSCP